MPSDVPPYLTFDQCLRHWAQHRPHVTALTDEGREYDYAMLDDLTARVASLLLNLGLRKGDRIAWLGKNADLYVILLFGAARLGVVMTPVGWRLSAEEWSYIVNDAQARILFVGAGFEDRVAAIASTPKGLDHIVSAVEAWTRIEATSPGAFEPADADDAALQLYTSGTTGRPKGAVLSNRNLFGLQIPRVDPDAPWMHWDTGEGMLCSMPCAHIGGSGLYVRTLAAGATIHNLAEFNSDEVLDRVEKGGVTRFFLVPAALQLLLENPRCTATDFSCIKYILYGAAPIPLELLRRCISVFQAQFIQAYGMTETTGGIVMLPPKDHDPEGNPRMRSAGLAVKGVELRIVGPDGNELATGEVGEISVRSTNNMLGYWNLPEATARTMTDDGWIHTGDAGYLDEDGYLYIHDRMKDMIISGGENVYPAEVESAIYGHPAVQEVAVIGIPDPKWGETVKAVVVPKPGMTVEAEDIIAWARERIAAFKAPRSVDVIEALPRNASGKILRKDLRAPYWEGYERMVN